jgi:hypothetical protein
VHFKVEAHSMPDSLVRLMLDWRIPLYFRRRGNFGLPLQSLFLPLLLKSWYLLTSRGPRTHHVFFWLETCSWIFDEARSRCLDVKICSATIYCSAYMFYLTNVLASTSLSNWHSNPFG